MMEQWEVQGDDREAADGSAREDQQGCGVKTWFWITSFSEKTYPKTSQCHEICGMLWGKTSQNTHGFLYIWTIDPWT